MYCLKYIIKSILIINIYIYLFIALNKLPNTFIIKDSALCNKFYLKLFYDYFYVKNDINFYKS